MNPYLNNYFAVSALSPHTQLLQHDYVESVEEDRLFYSGGGGGDGGGGGGSGAGAQSVTSSRDRHVDSWGLDSLDGTPGDGRLSLPCNLTGVGVDVYVVDTGVRYSHAEFAGGRARYPGCDPVDALEEGGEEAQLGADCTNHGTHIAGTIGGARSGVAPGVDLYSVRVVNCRGVGSAATILHGLECVLNRTRARAAAGRPGPSIVNLSIFGEKIRAVKRAVERLLRAGVAVVGIAGNAARDSPRRPRNACRLAPAAIPGVLAASASSRAGAAYERSNAGTCVDIYAPGEAVRSASAECDDCYGARSGSSMAAPHVAGAAALLLERCPAMPPWRVRHAILSRLARLDALDMSRVPRRLRRATPNLSLHLSEELCTMEC